MIYFGMLILDPLRCKTNLYGPKPLKASEDGNLVDSNVQTKHLKMHATTSMAGIMLMGHPNQSKA